MKPQSEGQGTALRSRIGLAPEPLVRNNPATMKSAASGRRG